MTSIYKFLFSTLIVKMYPIKLMRHIFFSIAIEKEFKLVISK